MNIERLLAKSKPFQNSGRLIPHDSIYLLNHLQDAYRAAIEIFEHSGNNQLAALGLQIDDWRDRFFLVSTLSAALHDIGKANDHFQGMVQKSPDRECRPQAIRHEWVGLLILRNPDIRNWLTPIIDHEDLNWMAMEYAITGHHPALHRDSPPLSPKGMGEGSEMTIYMGHSDFQQILTWIQQEYGLDAPPTIQTQTWRLSYDVFSQFRCYKREAKSKWDSLSDDQRRFISLIKSCLLGIDVAAFAMPCDQNKQQKWIGKALCTYPKPGDLQNVIAERLECAPTDIESNLRAFQKQTAESTTDLIYIKAGCGSGKTLAAYYWALHQSPGRRLYFAYPTTGTTTEGFRDYFIDSDSMTVKHNAELFHSRRDIDWQLILEVQDDDEKEVIADRIESLHAWTTPITCCTVDVVLGIIQNYRKSLYAWPVFSQSAFIFDEIHSYDEALFGALCKFIENLKGLPILLMSASLPDYQFDLLRKSLRKRGCGLKIIEGPTELEEIPRYQQHFAAQYDEPLPMVQQIIQEGGKVLWVCNTVDRAIKSAELAIEAGLFPILYHSRFKYIDRVRHHIKVIEAFKGAGAALTICTQVAEMSLDISADFLVSDIAPVPSLIQRMGRLNRRAKPGDPAKPFVIVKPLNQDGSLSHLPYEMKDLDNAILWLNTLPKRDLSQRDLANVWEQSLNGAIPSSKKIHSAWLDGGPFTNVCALRDVSPGISIILEEDVPSVKNGMNIKSLILPMNQPRGNSWKSWGHWKGIPITPSGTIIYDSEIGARWK